MPFALNTQNKAPLALRRIRLMERIIARAHVFLGLGTSASGGLYMLFFLRVRGAAQVV